MPFPRLRVATLAHEMLPPKMQPRSHEDTKHALILIRFRGHVWKNIVLIRSDPSARLFWLCGGPLRGRFDRISLSSMPATPTERGVHRPTSRPRCSAASRVPSLRSAATPPLTPPPRRG